MICQMKNEELSGACGKWSDTNAVFPFKLPEFKMAHVFPKWVRGNLLADPHHMKFAKLWRD